MMWNQFLYAAWRLKKRMVALRADENAVVTDSPNMALILANYYAPDYRIEEGRDRPSLPEPATIMNTPHITPAAVHMQFST